MPDSLRPCEGGRRVFAEPWLATRRNCSGYRLAPGSEDEPKSKQDARPQAPSDYRIFEQDMAGAYFIAPALMDKYKALQKRVADLRAEINGARIDPARARAEVACVHGGVERPSGEDQPREALHPRCHGPQADRDRPLPDQG